MIVTLPKLGAVKFKDDLTKEEFHNQVQHLATTYGFEMPKLDYGYMGSLTKGISRGATRLGETFGDVVPAMAASALGFEDYAKKQMAEAAETERQLAETNPAQFPSYKDVSGVGEAVKFGLENIGEQVPNIASMLVPGGVGGAVARRGALGLAESAMAGRVATGQAVGTYLGSYAQNAPEVFQNIYESSGGKLEPGAAMLAGSVSAALDSVLPASILSKLTGPAKLGLVESLLTRSGMEPTLARRAAVSVVEGGAIEGLTEGAQEAISIAAEKYINNNPQIFDSKDWDRIVESSVRGSIGGGVFGGVSGTVEGVRAGAEQRRITDEQLSAIQQERDMRDAEIARLQEANIAQQEAEAAAQPKTPTLALPAPQERPTLVVFPDGSTGTFEDAQNYIASLPEDQQNEARAKMAGLPYSTPPRTVITKEDIKDFGINPRTVAAKKLQGLNVSTYENRDLMAQVLEENKGIIKNPEAVEVFVSKLPKPTKYTVGAVENILSQTEQEFKNTTQLKKFLINEIGEDNLTELKNADPKVLAKLLRTSKEKAEEVIPSGGPTDEVGGASTEVLREPVRRELQRGVEQPDGGGVAGIGSDVGVAEEGTVPQPTALEQAPEKTPEEAQVASEVVPERTAIPLSEVPPTPSQAANPWLAMSQMGQEQQARMEKLGGKKKAEPEFVSEEDMTDEEVYAKHKATVSKVLEKAAGAKYVVPEDNVSLNELLNAIAGIMYYHVKRGARNMKDAINRARQALGNRADAISQKQYEEAFTAAVNRVESAVATSGFSPAGAKEAIQSIGNTIQSYAPGSQEIYSATQDILSRLPDDTRRLMLGFYSVNDLSDVYGDVVPALKNLSQVLGERAANAYERRHRVEQLVSKGAKLAKQYKGPVFDKFNRITFQLSVDNIDPRDAVNKDNALVKTFNTLPKELQDIAIEYANEYDKYADEFLELITKSLPEKMGRDYLTQSEKTRLKFESGRVKFYHPLRRVGNYWLTYTDKDGERVTIARETPNQIQDEIAKARLKGGKEFSQYSKISQISYRQAPPTGFIGEIIGKMVQAGVSEDVLNQTYQSYLSLFPAESLRQQFRQREGTAGYIEDVVQGFADVGSKMAHQLSQLEYRPDLDKVYDEMRAQISPDPSSNPPKELVDLYDEMMKRKDFVDNPIADTLSSRAAYVSYFWNIAGNVSSAFINLTQLPMVVFPLLSGKYGFGNSFKAMRNATKIYMAGGLDTNREFLPDFTAYKNSSLSPEHKKLFESALNSAALRRGVGYELTEMRRTKTEDYTGTRAKIETGLGWVFQNSERANREITLIAAYDLARKGGMSPDQATKYAIKLMIDAHGNSLSEAGPRYFQNGAGRIAFTFKHFAQTQIALQAKLFHRAFKGTDPEIRKLAQKQLLGIYGTSFAFAGLQGIPLYGAGSVLASMLNAMFGDDDEPFDPDEAVQSAMGTLAYKGPLNQLLGVDIASRTGFNNMFWRDDPRRLAEVGMAPYIAEHFFGPTYQALFVNTGRAKDLFNQGHTERAIETLVPSFIRNPLKAWRFATEGALTKDGAPIIDNYGAYSSLMQVFGFSNTDLAEAYARAGARKAAEKQILTHRQALMDAMWIARNAGDIESEAIIQENIDSFSDKFPGAKITQGNLQQSYDAHLKKIQDSIDGVSYNAKLKDQVMEEYGNF